MCGVFFVLYCFKGEKSVDYLEKEVGRTKCIITELHLKWTASLDALILANSSLKNQLILSMQNIDSTRSTTAQLRAKKRNLRKNYIK